MAYTELQIPERNPNSARAFVRRRNLSFPDIAYGSLELLQEYLENGGTADLKDEQGLSLMHAAAQANEVSKVELLLHHGGDVNARNAEGFTPLQVAYINKHVSVLDILQEHNADVKSVFFSELNLLHFSASPTHTCRSCNVDKEFESYQQMAPLLHAIFTSRLAVEKLILTKGHECDVNMLFKDLKALQCWSPYCENSCSSILPKDFVSRLRDQRERQRDLAIHLIYQDLELMKLFLNRASELNLQFLLQQAVKHGHVQAVELILTEISNSSRMATRFGNSLGRATRASLLQGADPWLTNHDPWLTNHDPLLTNHDPWLTNHDPLLTNYGYLNVAERIPPMRFDYSFKKANLLQAAVHYGQLEVAELILTKFDNPFKPYILRVLLNLQPKSTSERLVKFIVKPYSLATTCSMENSVLRGLMFCRYKYELTDMHLSREKEILRVLIHYGLVIHSQAIRRFHRAMGLRNQRCTSSSYCFCITCCASAFGISDMPAVTSLKGQCCSVIRQNVRSCRGRFDFKTVRSLPLPGPLIDFICMKDW